MVGIPLPCAHCPVSVSCTSSSASAAAWPSGVSSLGRDFIPRHSESIFTGADLKDGFAMFLAQEFHAGRLRGGFSGLQDVFRFWRWEVNFGDGVGRDSDSQLELSAVEFP